jgi:tetratricopeptide (TPR) repeat protein
MSNKKKDTGHSQGKGKGGPGEKKTFAFKIAAVLFPFLLLLLLEAGLRLGGYGSDFPVFVETDERPGYRVINSDVSMKYFFSAENATSGYQEYFKKDKEPDTIRIFVLGASTGIGYPYLKNGSFHRWLQYGLNETFPDKNFEIINLSLTAVNSYTLLDFTDAVIKNEPDAVLIYAGHNEYYGALGVGAVNSLGKYPRLVNAVLQLRDLRIIQLAADWYLRLKKQFYPGTGEQETRMKKMVAKQSISYESDLYRDGISQFKYNMDALLSQLNEDEVPTFISTLVSNEKDVTPFISDSSSQENSAVHHFKRGTKEYKEGRFKQAKKAFEQAKELDMLRFRAPEEINASIKNFANAYPNTHLVDTKKSFEAASPHSSIGNELLMEHLHPNLQGYSLLGYEFYRSLKKYNPFGLEWKDTLSLAALRTQMPITELDSLQGAYEVQILKQGWPYNEKNKIKEPSSTPEKITANLVLKKISWEAAMQQLFQYYEKNEETEKALQALESFSLEHPENANMYFRSADLALQLNKYPKADRLFAKGFEQKKTASAARQIALKLIRSGRLESAATYLDFVSANEPRDNVSNDLQESIATILSMPEPVTSQAEKIKKMLALAEIYAAVGSDDKAAGYIEEVLMIDPSNAAAKSLLKKINS